MQEAKAAIEELKMISCRDDINKELDDIKARINAKLNMIKQDA